MSLVFNRSFDVALGALSHLLLGKIVDDIWFQLRDVSVIVS